MLRREPPLEGRRPLEVTALRLIAMLAPMVYLKTSPPPPLLSLLLLPSAAAVFGRERLARFTAGRTAAELAKLLVPGRE